MTFEEFHDPRLVTLSLTLDEGRDDLGFYLDLARRLQVGVERPLVVVDIGCGTGELAVALAARGCAVTGVEPSSAMLAAARMRPDADRVRWIEGDASALEVSDASVDLVVMTGHVAQVISDEDAWRSSLESARRALRSGGRLAFESRNPAAKAWERWTAEQSRALVPTTPLGTVTWWCEGTTVDDELVSYEIHYVLEDTGEEFVSKNLLRFRSWDRISDAVHGAGLEVEHVFGNHARAPFEVDSPEFVVIARRR